MPETPSPRLRPLRHAVLWKLAFMLVWPFFIIGSVVILVIAFFRIPFQTLYEDENGRIHTMKNGIRKLIGWKA